MVSEPSIYLWGCHKTGGLWIAGKIIRHSSTECAGCSQISKNGGSQLTIIHPSIHPFSSAAIQGRSGKSEGEEQRQTPWS